MSTYKVVYKPSTREARVLDGASATPAGFQNWGTFNRAPDPHKHDAVALFHAVRDLAYKAGFQNMQNITVTQGDVSIPAPAT